MKEMILTIEIHKETWIKTMPTYTCMVLFECLQALCDYRFKDRPINNHFLQNFWRWIVLDMYTRGGFEFYEQDSIDYGLHIVGSATRWSCQKSRYIQVTIIGNKLEWSLSAGGRWVILIIHTSILESLQLVWQPHALSVQCTNCSVEAHVRVMESGISHRTNR